MILRLPDNAEAASLTYLAWLAYPAAYSEAKRRDAFMKACVFHLHRRNDIAPRHMPPAIATMKPKRVEATINSAWSRIVHRRVAAVYAWIRLMEQRRGVGSVTASDDVEVDVNGAASIAEAGAMWCQMHYNRDLAARSVTDPRGSDFRSRTWRPTQPVMPLAVAFCFSRASISALTERLTGKGDIGDIRMDGPIGLGLRGCITSPGWVQEAVSVAQVVTDQRDPDIIFPVF